MVAQRFDGKACAAEVEEELLIRIAACKEKGINHIWLLSLLAMTLQVMSMLALRFEHVNVSESKVRILN